MEEDDEVMKSGPVYKEEKKKSSPQKECNAQEKKVVQ